MSKHGKRTNKPVEGPSLGCGVHTQTMDLMIQIQKSLGLSMLDEMKIGDMFQAVESFYIDYLIWKGEPDPDENCPVSWDCAKCTGEEWASDFVDVGDTLMYISEPMDEDELEYGWLITSVETGQVRVRKGLVMPYRLARMF